MLLSNLSLSTWGEIALLVTAAAGTVQAFALALGVCIWAVRGRRERRQLKRWRNRRAPRRQWNAPNAMSRISWQLPLPNLPPPENHWSTRLDRRTRRCRAGRSRNASGGREFPP